MIRYSIKELGQISGIKPHTIRIWEQRYDLLKPLRSDTNIRYYGNDELKKLLNVCELMNAGMKISKISTLSQTEISAEIEKIINTSAHAEVFVNTLISQAIVAISTFDEALFDKTFSTALSKLGSLQEVYFRVIYPLLVKIGLMWTKDDLMPAQEHFLSNLIKQKLFAAIDSLPPVADSPQRWVLFLNENEEHEIGLLLAYYLIRQHRQKAVYLGSNVPFDNLENVLIQCNATHAYTFFIKNQSAEKIRNIVDGLTKNFSETTLLVSGRAELIEPLNLNSQLIWIKDIEQLKNIFIPLALKP